MDERPPSTARAPGHRLFLLGVIVPAVVLVLAGAVVVLIPRSSETTQCFPEYRLYRLARVVLLPNEPPLAPDGRLDVYAILRHELRDDREGIVGLCVGTRSGTGPSWREVEAGDYANFPYGRRKGSFSQDADPPVPILWERRSSPGNGRIVAFSDGEARVLGDAEAGELFRDNPGQE